MRQATTLARASACASVMALVLSMPLYAASQDAPLSQVSLQTALASAEASWAAPASAVTTIRAAHLNDCQPHNGKLDMIAWSSFAAHTITLNSACEWTTQWMRQVVLHEVGHMLLNRPGHSTDKRSIMYPIVYGRGQGIKRVDRSTWGGM